ncbi:MAG: cytochrome b [Thiothrix sp.]|nr:cytochrome b [Thiothrix sp.]
MLKSHPERYGAVIVTLHWLTAILILTLFISGFSAVANAGSPDESLFLRIHVPVGITVLVLTVARLAWWWLADRKPLPIASVPRWQEGLARAVHVTLYLILFAMFGSGIALMALSGAGAVLFGTGTLPDFTTLTPFTVHGGGAILLLLLLVLHSGAALYHHFIRHDGIFARMWYSRDSSNVKR